MGVGGPWGRCAIRVSPYFYGFWITFVNGFKPEDHFLVRNRGHCGYRFVIGNEQILLTMKLMEAV